MKIGAKEMKRAYKDVKVDQIDVSLSQEIAFFEEVLCNLIF